MSRRIAIYARQSIRSSEGIDRQLAKCREMIERHARDKDPWIEVATYEDNDTSATKARGPKTAWGRMLVDFESGQFDIAIAVDIDRLLRSLRDLLALTDRKMVLATVNGDIDLTSSDGQFRASMLAAVASFETQRKSERQQRANAHRLSQGKPIAGGRRRFGFMPDHQTVVEAEAIWIRNLYDRVAEGESIRSLTRELNENEVPTVSEWLRPDRTSEPVGAGLWTVARVSKLLRNPAYRGALTHKHEVVPGASVPEIVAPELWARVSVILADPDRRKSPAGPGRSALLGGIVLCATCEEPLVTAGTGRSGSPIHTYACSNVKKGKGGGLSHPAIRRSVLDPLVDKELAKALIYSRQAPDLRPSSARIQALELLIKERNEALDDLLELIADRMLDKNRARRRMGQLNDELAEAAEERQALFASDVRAQVLQDVQRNLLRGPDINLNDVAAALSALKVILSNLDLDRHRLLVETMLQVRVAPGRGASRVRFTHLVATQLNDDAEQPTEDADEIEPTRSEPVWLESGLELPPEDL